MKIAVFGLGYVGTVSAACLSQNGHDVIGVDVNPKKLELINQGTSPIVEPDLEGILAESVEAGRLRATSNPYEAISEADVSLVCVGTPSRENGSLDLSYARNVASDIGQALQRKDVAWQRGIRNLADLVRTERQTIGWRSWSLHQP